MSFFFLFGQQFVSSKNLHPVIIFLCFYWNGVITESHNGSVQNSKKALFQKRNLTRETFTFMDSVIWGFSWPVVIVFSPF